MYQKSKDKGSDKIITSELFERLSRMKGANYVFHIYQQDFDISQLNKIDDD